VHEGREALPEAHAFGRMKDAFAILVLEFLVIKLEHFSETSSG